MEIMLWFLFRRRTTKHWQIPSKRGFTMTHLTAKCCIFRIPEVLHRHNGRVYEPDFVAIGPDPTMHHSKPSLQPMEYVKQWYLQNLLSHLNQTGLNISMLRDIKELHVNVIKNQLISIKMNS